MIDLVPFAEMATKPVSPCDLPHCFSLTTSGERLGEMAAVLAGLTFPAVIFLGRREEEEESLGDTQIMLLAAFVSLATATYLFSGVAAEEQQAPRAAFESFVASLALSLSLQLLFLGIAQLLLHHAVPKATLFTTRVSILFVGPTIFAFMGSTAANAVELYAPQEEVYRSSVAVICGFAFLALFALALFLSFVDSKKWPRGIAPSATMWAGGILGIVALAAALTLFWAEGDSKRTTPSWTYLLLMGLLLLATVGYSLRLTTIAAEAHEWEDASQQKQLL